MPWIAFLALAALTLLIMLVPLLRARPKAMARAEYDLTVYKDQLAELDRELERGTLSADQAEAARTEIQRRILAVADQGKERLEAPRRPFGLAATLAALLPVGAFGTYLALGSPHLPDQPFAARSDQMQQMQDQARMIEGMVASLTAKLEKNPNDPQGWAMLGRSLRVMGQTDKAKDAYARAARLMPGNTEVRMEYAALLLDEVPQGAPLPPEFVGTMREINAVDPENLDALYFLGLSEAQTGNAAKARDYWTRLLAKLPPESEDRATIQSQLDALR